MFCEIMARGRASAVQEQRHWRSVQTTKGQNSSVRLEQVSLVSLGYYMAQTKTNKKTHTRIMTVSMETFLVPRLLLRMKKECSVYLLSGVHHGLLLLYNNPSSMLYNNPSSMVEHGREIILQ